RLGRELVRESFEAGAAGEHGYGYLGREGVGSAASVPARETPLSELPASGPGGPTQLQEDDGTMSPLTRLLAETPVRLAPAGDLRRRPEAYPTTGAPAARSTGDAFHAHDPHDGFGAHHSHPVPAAPQSVAAAEVSVVEPVEGGTSWPARAKDGSAAVGYGLGAGGVASGSGAAR
ncbi:unnamed protein product, partial [Scytosiphon promiscuus]